MFFFKGGNPQHFCPFRFSRQCSNFEILQNANYVFCTERGVHGSDLRYKENQYVNTDEKI